MDYDSDIILIRYSYFNASTGLATAAFIDW